MHDDSDTPKCTLLDACDFTCRMTSNQHSRVKLLSNTLTPTVVTTAPIASYFSEACIPPIWRREQQQLTIMFTAPSIDFPMYYDKHSTLWLDAVVGDANAMVEVP